MSTYYTCSIALSTFFVDIGFSVMDTRKRGTTPEMQVTSIRLEPELKERLREISGDRGYQFLIREVLWQFVETSANSLEPGLTAEPSPSSPHFSRISRGDIRAVFRAIAQREEQCVITGQQIYPQQSMWLGLTNNGCLVTLSNESLA